MRVEPVTAAWAEALAQGDAEFTRRFGVPVAAGWAGFPETLPLLVRATRQGNTAQWGPHLVFDHDGSLVGNAGWKGHPVDGVAELGYAVAPTRRDRGIATAAVSELLRRAHNAGLRLVIAHTLAKESASTTVLRRCGFTKTTTRTDPDDGEVWRWERTLPLPLNGVAPSAEVG